MNWLGFLMELERSGVSRWVRESDSMLAFPTIIALHAIGMGLLVGANAVVDLRVLGFAPGVPLSSMEGFFPVMRFGFWLNLLSGLLLLAAYPAKALTNPLFYIKLVLIAVALIGARMMRSRLLRNPAMDRAPVPAGGRIMAGGSLAVWALAVTAGRLLAYTYSLLMASGLQF